MRGVHESIPATEDQIRKVYEAGFRDGVSGFYRLPEEEVKRRLQQAWKKFCGCDS